MSCKIESEGKRYSHNYLQDHGR